MKTKVIILALMLMVAKSGGAQNLTFAEHIAPIIYQHCTSCHRQGEIAPFPLTNYQEVADWGSTIQYVTQIGYMPPWKPDPNYRTYQRENYLSAEEKQQISDWVDQGMPEGNPALTPNPPAFPSGSQVGVPDHVVSFSQSYLHQGNNQDEYRYFVIPSGLTEDKNIRAMEFRPGNKQIVHHALIWEDTTGSAAAADALTPEYGYTGGQGSAADLDQVQFPGYVPGQSPVIYSQGITQRLHAGSDLKIQMHYAPSAADETDSSSINIFFENGTANRLLKSYIMTPLGQTLVNGPFVMPPNETREFHGVFNVPFSVSLYGVAPHCHKLGTHWTVYAVTPQNDTINLIKISDWDFNWQGAYQFKQLLKIPAGSVLHAFAGYDNTTNNPTNPNNPPQTVTWGEGTSDEMFYLPFLYLNYQPGDENIVFEEENPVGNSLALVKATNKLYPVFPSPASDVTRYGFTLETSGTVEISLLSLDGKLVSKPVTARFHLPGYHINDLDLSGLPSGVYLLEMNKDGERQSQKLVVQH